MREIDRGPEEVPFRDLESRLISRLPVPSGSRFWRKQPSTIPGNLFLTTQDVNEAALLTKAVDAAGAHTEPRSLGWSAGSHSEEPKEEDWINSKFMISVKESALVEITRQMEKNGYPEEK